MKCRRTGYNQQRLASMDEDDDEDECCMDATTTDGKNGPGGSGTGASADGVDCPPAAVPPAAKDCRARESPEDLPTGPIPRVNFDAHSDPPGALRRYLDSDSDLPAPAAPSSDHVARVTGVSKPLWMQPDPVVPGGALGPGAGSGGAELLGVSSLSWDSAFSRTAGCAASCRNSSGGFGGAARSFKRSRDAAAVNPLCEQLQQHQHPESLPRLNPFAEVAAAAAAAAGLPAVRHALPAARDAAALLRYAAEAAVAPLRPPSARVELWAEPAWLHRAGAELAALMREMGLLATDSGGNAAPLPGMRGQPRVLCSRAPLTLPEPVPHRDLDGLLRRRLQAGDSWGQPAAVVAAAAGRADAAAGCVSWGARAAGPQGVQGLARVAGGGGGSGMPGFMAIDSLPLEILL